MRRSWRNKFDLERDFVVRRTVTVGGVALAPGDPFDKTLVNVRRLRQLYDNRTIMFAGDQPGAVLRSSKDAFRRQRGDASLGDGVQGPGRDFTAEELEAERAAWARIAADLGANADRDQLLKDRAAVPIPTDWPKLRWPDRLKLAASLSDTPIKGKEDAAAAVNAELARRGAS